MTMPFRRAPFVLTPPSFPIFVVSLILAVLALLVHYGGVSMPLIPGRRAFDVLAVGYVLLLVGVLVRRL
jgi:hypothetical protein